MEELTTIIEKATAGISAEYFYLRIDGGDSIYRERVYCYELYHQMRLCWPENSKFYLNGEIDKAAHPILKELGADYAKPDLLVHQPGYMKGNHAIIEVKSSQAEKKGILKDLETLSIFKNKVGYQRAIYLFYGNDLDGIPARVKEISTQVDKLASIELWLHREPNKPAIKVSS
ncbi:MAG: hypothetical protein JW806_00520 [Sedimentisphaerales bacterium]|nr:hypothetical protein [Sedimentisphaerales bacterium]